MGFGDAIRAPDFHRRDFALVQQLVPRFGADSQGIAHLLDVHHIGILAQHHTVGIALALGVEDMTDLYLDSEPKLNRTGQQRLGEYRSMLLHTAEFVERQEHTLRLLPVYLQPASAGTGQWLDDDAQEMTEVDESVPTKAEFGVRIAGDSMEPRFVNGQTVWVKAAQDANNGDIVLCTLNDQGYCKKLCKDENGIALISLNKKYAPIPVREEDEFRIAGIVVG